jgi:hypothetical protein
MKTMAHVIERDIFGTNVTANYWAEVIHTYTTHSPSGLREMIELSNGKKMKADAAEAIVYVF